MFSYIGVIEDIPMLKVLEASSEHVFVPLTVGGGIREYTDINGVEYSALDVVTRYFRAGKCVAKCVYMDRCG